MNDHFQESKGTLRYVIIFFINFSMIYSRVIDDANAKKQFDSD